MLGRLFDSHAHLDDAQFRADFEDVIASISASAVQKVVDVGADMESSKKAAEIAARVPFVYAAVGLHPCDADQCTPQNMEHLRLLAQREKVVAIGESGLDYHWDDCPRAVQRQSFIEHIMLANDLHLPLIVHDRDAHGDTLEILQRHRPNSAIIHCFSGSAEMARELVKMGYYISFSGSLTFKNAKNLPAALREVPIDRLLVETDSPYLSPEPYRGKRNNPTRVEYTARRAAEILDIPYAVLCERTYANAMRVYQLEETE